MGQQFSLTAPISSNSALTGGPTPGRPVFTSDMLIQRLQAAIPQHYTVAFRVLNCHDVANPGRSNGYEDVASVFIAGRARNSSGVGASVVAMAGLSYSVRWRLC